MINALRYEVVRLRTLRSTWWMLATSLLITTGVALLFAGLSVSHDYQGNLVVALTTLAGQVIPVQALLVGLVGAFAIGHEHRYGTIRLTLAVLPKRHAVVLAKVLVVATWAVIVAALTLALAYLAMRLWPGARILSDPVPDRTLVRICVGFVLLALMWSLIGLSLAGLLRNLPGAIVILVVWPLVVEPILGFITFIPGLSGLRSYAKYLPFNAGQQLLAVGSTTQGQGNGPGTLPQLDPWDGGLVMAVLTVVLLLAWWIAFRSSDA